MKNNTSDELDYNQNPPKDIFAYNELRSCSDIFNLYKLGTLEIQPEFQRNEVWPSTFRSRFIDSLLKEMPIPSMCFSYDKERNKMQVIDGLQRVSTIIKFLDVENEFRLSKLDDIDDRLSGLSNTEIYSKNKKVIDQVANLALPVTFLRVNYDRADHNEYMFQIFHRLNTYGSKLNNQEIRNCIYSGNFNNLLKQLNKNQTWKSLLGFTSDTRFLKTELILRFFAFEDPKSAYDGHLIKFLNTYMSKHRDITVAEWAERQSKFEKTVNLINSKITKGKVLTRKSNAFVDALFVGVSKNLKFLEEQDDKVVQGMFKKLNTEDSFSEKSLSESIMKKIKVDKRLEVAKNIFSGK